jgi:carbamoyl-phosphate synthase large subunit
LDDAALRRAVEIPTDERLWALAEAFRRGWSVDEVRALSKIDAWFLHKIQGIVATELRLQAAAAGRVPNAEVAALVAEAYALGFSRSTILELCGIGSSAGAVAHGRDLNGSPSAGRSQREDQVRRSLERERVFKMVDTCAGEFESRTPYYYSALEPEDERVTETNARQTPIEAKA